MCGVVGRASRGRHTGRTLAVTMRPHAPHAPSPPPPPPLVVGLRTQAETTALAISLSVTLVVLCVVTVSAAIVSFVRLSREVVRRSLVLEMKEREQRKKEREARAAAQRVVAATRVGGLGKLN